LIYLFFCETVFLFTIIELFAFILCAEKDSADFHSNSNADISHHVKEKFQLQSTDLEKVVHINVNTILSAR
jgi:hypothetical protein